uniref:NAC domain-containing protein 102-like isoform X1 n=1 Tax=Fragaria vesca subsp. vesca TaxID=101020 RepID=UPI0005C84F52|nr:PREDICTED: NAC domain-containing protein 102-like isoform X1 [Fragaria vesca subsp. vesca]XP_011464580.1 PREDICTED: NAC domain-containing protein 102-like isoform X1 [Fragaria vesca subsp. vesca]XP_011464581.1 PREDICTED: NAC domain-containing protein 102-like isoform X1 [Fragaria vesca subsp. vesca]
MDQQFATLAELSVGVVTTFQPSEAQLVRHYLYNKVFNDDPSSTFPQINIYGKDGLPPWEIWRIYQQCKYPHQEFIYFFSRAEKLNPNKTRHSRKIGTGTWHETENVRPIYVAGYEEAYGSLRKFRYQKKESKNEKDKKERDICDEHHGAWLMDEFTINQAPDLALYRLKVNAKGGDRKRKSSAAENNGEDESLMRSKQSLKKRKLEPRRAVQNSCMSEHQQSTTSQQMPSSYFHQVDQVVPENFPHEIEQILMSDDDDDENLSTTALLWNEAQLRACVARSIPDEQHPQPEQYSVAPQQQLGPESSSSQEEYQVQLPQQDQASSSHSNEQQLLADDYQISMIDFDSLDDTCFQSINGLFTDEDQPSTQSWWHLDGD